MTNELAVRGTMDELAMWVDTARATNQIAQGLAKTSFVPKSMQGRPDEITGAILAGREIGLDPMAALRSIDIIDGTPAVRALTLRAIVQKQGHAIWVEESTPTRAVVSGRRKGSDKTQSSEWTIERAKTAGLATKRNWQNNPEAMLIARATSEVARLIAADALLGMPYSHEELSDGISTVGPAATPTRRLKRVKYDPPAPDLDPFGGGDQGDDRPALPADERPALAASAHDEPEDAA